MAPKVLISDALSDAAVQIFKDRGVETVFQPKLGADKDKLAPTGGGTPMAEYTSRVEGSAVLTSCARSSTG